MYYLKTEGKPTQAPRNLGELIMAVSDSSKSQGEAVAAMMHLLHSGQVQVKRNGRKQRARIVC